MADYLPKKPMLVMRVTIELIPYAGAGMMVDATRDITTEMRMLRSDYEGLGPHIIRGIAAEAAEQAMDKAINRIRAADEAILKGGTDGGA